MKKIKFTVHHSTTLDWWIKTYEFKTLKELEIYLKSIGEIATVEKITWEKKEQYNLIIE